MPVWRKPAGIGYIKWNWKELSFRYLHENRLQEIATCWMKSGLNRESLHPTGGGCAGVPKLGAAGIKAMCPGRVKHIYSIWR